jgi:hypothetical protein
MSSEEWKKNSLQAADTGWLPVEGPLPWGWYLVTNNLKSRDNSGNMTHLWLVNAVYACSTHKGEYTAFYGANDQKIYGLKFYRPVTFATNLPKGE